MDFKQTFPLLFASKWTATGLAPAIAAVNRRDLYAEYQSLVGRAPRRADSGMPYFMGHDGVPSSEQGSNRGEEHCAIALFNLGKRWPCAHGGQFRLLDYQFPLQVQKGDGIGKIDLLGVTDKGRLMVIELKVKPGSGRGEAPPAALMQGLRYAAIVQANLDAIANEANARFAHSGVRVSNEPPMVLLLAPQAWWRGWQALPHTVAAGNWQSAFNALIQDVPNNIGVTIECAELQGGKPAMGLNGQKPKFDPAPTLAWR